MPALTVYKPREEIEESLHGVKRLFLVRCGICAALWWEHSSEAKRRLKGYLTGRGIEVTGDAIVFCACIPYGLQARMETFGRRIEQADAIGMVACPLGVNSAYLVTRRKKRVIPFLDMSSIYCCAYYNEANNPLLSACSGCGHCVLGLTEGICTVGNCVQGLRVPCRREEEIVRQCRQDPERDCPFFILKEKRLLEGLLAYERTLRRKNKEGETRRPLVEISRPFEDRRRRAKLSIASLFARFSKSFAVLSSITEQPGVRKFRF
jgi:hypothetical protein